MTDPRDIMNAVNPRINRILTAAEIGLAPHQFQAFRKIVLEEFGHNGLAQDIDDLCYGSSGKVWQGKGR